MERDPVEVALDAATEALCALPMSASHREEAAAAVAAFLRALPDEERLCGQSIEDFRALNEELAAAVARAGGAG